MREGFECLRFSYLGIRSWICREEEEEEEFQERNFAAEETNEVKCEIRPAFPRFDGSTETQELPLSPSFHFSRVLLCTAREDSSSAVLEHRRQFKAGVDGSARAD